MDILSRCNADIKVRNKTFSNLAIAIISSGIKENDVWFLKSDFGKWLLEIADERTQLKAKQIILDFEIRQKRNRQQALNACNTIIDDSFIELFNMFK